MLLLAIHKWSSRVWSRVKKVKRTDKRTWKRSISEMAGNQYLDKFSGDSKQFIPRLIGGKDASSRFLNQRMWDDVFVFQWRQSAKAVFGKPYRIFRGDLASRT